MFPKPNWMFKSFFDLESCMQFNQQSQDQLESTKQMNIKVIKQTVDQTIYSQINQQDIILETQFFKRSKKYMNNQINRQETNPNKLKKIKLVLVQICGSKQQLQENLYKTKYEIYYHIQNKNGLRIYHIPLTRLRLEKLQLDEGDDIFCYCLRFSKDQESIELYSHEKSVRYKVSKIIGKGHFAKVYLATRKEDNLQFAIKAFSKDYLYTQKQGKDSLIVEIELMRQLDYPNILKLYEIHETENSLYLVIELVKGGELLKMINNQQITKYNVARMMMKLLQAIEYMHSKGIMHRDLKPDNILIKSQSDVNEIVIADFGLATYQQISDQIFKRCGTPGYVAPEILKYQQGDPFYNSQCDLFSIGCIFYIFLVGRKLFKGKDQKEVIMLNRECEIDFKNISYFPCTSEEAKDLLQKLLRKDPNERITASDALQHPYILNIQQQEINDKMKGIRFEYDKDLMSSTNSNYRNIISTSHGSFQMNNKLIFKGNTDTIENVNSQINSIRNINQNSNDQQSEQKSIFQNQYQTVKNSLFKKQTKS